MRQFTYRAYDRDGRIVSGEIGAGSREAAIATLKGRGVVPVEIAEARSQGGSRDGQAAGIGVGAQATNLLRRWSWRRPDAIAARDLAAMTRELASLVTADVPLADALRIVALQPRIAPAVRRVLGDVLDRVLAGSSLSDALAAHPRDIPEPYWRLVAAAERSGKLGAALERQAAELERRREIADRIRSALIYPAILAVAAILTLAVVIGLLVPSIAPVFEQAGAPLPPVLGFLRGVQTAVATYWPLLLGVVAIAAIAITVLSGTRAARTLFEDALFGLPLVGRTLEAAETARFAATLATLLTSGVPLLDALRTTARTLRTRAYQSATEALAEGVARGATVSGAMADGRRFGELAVRLVGVGEATGKLADMLDRLAGILERSTTRDIDRATAILAPVLTLVIGAVVGGIVLSVMSALVGLNEIAIR